MSIAKTNILFTLSVLTIVLGTIDRVSFILTPSEKGGDDATHLSAVETVLNGGNPYKQTIQSFKNESKDPSGKGYAYFPALLYLYTFHYFLSVFLTGGINLMPTLFRLPGVLGDLGVGLLLLFYFHRQKKDDLAALFSALYWMFNYYVLARDTLARFDSLPIFFMLLALFALDGILPESVGISSVMGKSASLNAEAVKKEERKRDIYAGIFFSLSVLFKTFPVILFPLFMFKTKKPLRFLVAGLLTALILSLPFITNWENLLIYIQGTLLVHNERTVQGRPFLYLLSFLIHFELIRVLPFSLYSIGSIICGWVALCVNRVFSWIKDEYTASIIPFFIFYLLAPVLNRTYLIWWIPVLLIGLYNAFYKRNPALFYIFSGVAWGFLYWYLSIWDAEVQEGFLPL